MSIFPEKTIQEVLAAIDPVKLIRLINYRTDTVQDVQDQVKCFCPIHKEAVFRTLIIDKTAKDYKCSYSLCPGNSGGDLIDLYARVREISVDDALQDLVDEMHLAIELPATGEVIARTIEEGENFLYLVTADESRRDMYIEEANKRFQKILDIDPTNAKALRGLYRVMEFQGNTEHLTELSRQRIEVEVKAGRHQEIIELCAQHLEFEPENLAIRWKWVESLIALEQEEKVSEELMTLAESSEAQEDYDGAIRAYRLVAKIDILDIDVHPYIVNLLQALGRNEEAVAECIERAEYFAFRSQLIDAIEVLRSALDIDPERDEVRAKLVEYSLQLGLDANRIQEALALVDEMIGRNSLEAAAQILQSLCEADPSSPHLLDKLLEVKKRQGKTEEVLALQYRLADLYRDREDCASAILLLEEIAAATGGSIETLRRIAEIHRLEGDTDLAVKGYCQVVEKAAEEDKLEEAIESAEKIIELQPDDVNHRERLIGLLIRADRQPEALDKLTDLIATLDMIGDTERLVTQLETAVELAPERTELRLKLAEGRESLGDSEAGLDERMRIAEQFLGQKAYLKAIEQLETILEHRKNDLDALTLMADARVHTGRIEESHALLLEIASVHIQREDYAQARVVLERLLAQAPDHVEALTRLTDVHTGLGDEEMLIATLERLVAVHRARTQWQEARTHAEAILDLRRDHIQAHRSLVEVHENLGEPARVIDILLRMAALFQERNQPEDEKNALEQVLERDAANRPALRRLALARFEAEQGREALEFLDRHNASARNDKAHEESIGFLRTLLERDNDNVELHARLIDTLDEAQRPDQVVAQLEILVEIRNRRQEFTDVVALYRRILDIEPGNVIQRSNLIETLLRLQRTREAVEESLALSAEYERQERYDDAERVGLDILRIDGGSERAHRRLVEINRARGDHAKTIDWINKLATLQSLGTTPENAVETLREVFQIDPINVETHQRIVELHIQQGTLEKAIAEYGTLVEIHLQTGDVESAIETQRQAIALSPETIELRRGLVRIFLDRGDRDNAVQELFALAESAREREDFERALETLAEILEHDPDNFRARKLRGDIFIQTGCEKEALQELLALTRNLDNPDSLRTLGRTQTTYELPEELPLVEEYVFDNFVVGDRNNFAYATALATAKAPAKNYNPLFLYSDVGLGKTHLLHAIGNFIRAANPKARLLYTTSEEFTAHLIDAIQNNTVNQFRQAHREIDVLLIDDVQFLAEKERAQEEFFHIFNTLFQAKKQIVVTSDRPPKEIAHLEKRLKSRFGAGVVVDIHSPDIETRTAIVKREVQAWPDVGFTPEIIALIAQKIESNVRELKGTIRQIVAARDLAGEKLSLETVAQILDRHLDRI